MRLTCPTCAAQYEVAEGLIAVGGQHVQCTACHTRWFSRPPPRPSPRLISEDEIIARLETRRRGPRPVPERGASSELRPQRQSGAEFAWEGRGVPAAQPEASAASAPPNLRLVEPAPQPAPDAPEPAPEPAAARAAALAGEPSPHRPAPTRPGSMPPPSRGAAEPADAGAARAASLRLDLHPPPAAAAAGAPKVRRRHGRGLVAGLVVVALPVAVYLAADAVADSVPPLAPYAQQYAAFVDDTRLRVEARLAPLIEDLRTVAPSAD